MYCPKCARENPDLNKFCNGCGATLKVEVVSPRLPLPLPPPPPNKKILTAAVIVAEEPITSSTDYQLNTEKHISAFQEDVVTEGIKKPDAGELNEMFNPIVSPQELSRVFADAELALDSVLIDRKDSAVPNQTVPNQVTPDEFSALPASDQRALQIPNPLSENKADDYFSEVQNKYGVPENRQPATHRNFLTNNKNYLIGGGVAAVAVIGLTAAIATSWYLINRSKPAEVTASNSLPVARQTPIVNQINSDQPPAGMVYVKGGQFMMGNNAGDDYERPAHQVSVNPFFIDKTEVTCESYKKFMDATGYRAPVNWQNNNFPAGAAQKPVTGVNWDDANAYAQWQNKRLPSEEEWEFAARGTDGRMYPWGNEWKPELANADKQKDGVQEVGLAAGKSPFGVFDLAGNAWEWTGSPAEAYPGGKAFDTKSADPKIIRGGFYGSSRDKATTTFRRAWGAHSEASYDNTGFRCAAEIPAKPSNRVY